MNAAVTPAGSSYALISRVLDFSRSNPNSRQSPRKKLGPQLGQQRQALALVEISDAAAQEQEEQGHAALTFVPERADAGDVGPVVGANRDDAAQLDRTTLQGVGRDVYRTVEAHSLRPDTLQDDTGFGSTTAPEFRHHNRWGTEVP